MGIHVDTETGSISFLEYSSLYEEGESEFSGNLLINSAITDLATLSVCLSVCLAASQHTWVLVAVPPMWVSGD